VKNANGLESLSQAQGIETDTTGLTQVGLNVGSAEQGSVGVVQDRHAGLHMEGVNEPVVVDEPGVHRL